MGKNVFLTGASGYFGRVLIKHLVDMPEIDKITGLYNTTTPSNSISPKVNFVKMDIRSPDLAAAMAGHEIVINNAFIVLWSSKMPEAVRDDINFNGTRNIANAAIKNRIRCFIHASSAAAYDSALARGKDNLNEDFPIGNGLSPSYYWNSKAKADKILKEVLDSSGITLTLLRPTYVIGPLNNKVTVTAYRETAANFLGYDPRIQFIHEDDLASAFMHAMQADMPGAYNVVPDDFIRLSELLRVIGCKFTMTVPAWLAFLVALIRWKYFGYHTHPSWVKAILFDYTCSNEKLKATGWKPQYRTRDAILTAL
jgi:UDP-glucose 4-epimerase